MEYDYYEPEETIGKTEPRTTSISNFNAIDDTLINNEIIPKVTSDSDELLNDGVCTSGNYNLFSSIALSSHRSKILPILKERIIKYSTDFYGIISKMDNIEDIALQWDQQFHRVILFEDYFSMFVDNNGSYQSMFCNKVVNYISEDDIFSSFIKIEITDRLTNLIQTGDPLDWYIISLSDLFKILPSLITNDKLANIITSNSESIDNLEKSLYVYSMIMKLVPETVITPFSEFYFRLYQQFFVDTSNVKHLNSLVLLAKNTKYQFIQNSQITLLINTRVFNIFRSDGKIIEQLLVMHDELDGTPFIQTFQNKLNEHIEVTAGLLASHIDQSFRKIKGPLPYTQSSRYIRFIELLEGKTLFETDHYYLLKSRLLKNRKKTFAADLLFVHQLDAAFGTEFTVRLHSIMNDFKSYQEGIVNIILTSSSFWQDSPEYSSNHHPTIQSVLSNFENTYVAQNSNKRIVWNDGLTSCTLNLQGVAKVHCDGIYGTFLLNLSSEPQNIHEVERKTGFSISKIRSMTQFCKPLVTINGEMVSLNIEADIPNMVLNIPFCVKTFSKVKQNSMESITSSIISYLKIHGTVHQSTLYDTITKRFTISRSHYDTLLKSLERRGFISSSNSEISFNPN